MAPFLYVDVEYWANKLPLEKSIHIPAAESKNRSAANTIYAISNNMHANHVGKIIGSGRDRNVHQHKICPGWVIKIPKNEKAKHQNVNEIMVWHFLKDKPDGRWLTPIIDHCPNSEWIIMEKVGRADHNFPRKNLPNWFADYHTKHNWGIFEERYVLCDYGFDQIARKLMLLR